MSVGSQQRGTILIMVLLIVAIVAGLGIKFAGDYQFGLARAEARWHGAQARAYLFSGEGAAIKFLATDDATADYPDELWGQPVPIPLEDGSGEIDIQVKDANGQFNLNSLVGTLDPGKDPMDSTRYTPPQRMFIRLLQVLVNEEDRGRPILNSPNEAAGILEAIADWTDADNNPSGSYGAEDDYYLSQRDPYKTANMPFRSVEELQFVRGITPALMKALRPYVTVLLPVEKMNINTVPSLFFRCVNVSTDLMPLPEATAASLEKEKPNTGHYASIADFDSAWTKIGGAGGQVDKEFDVKTNFFWLTTVARIGQQRRIGRSLLQRGTKAFSVVRREEKNNSEAF